MRRLNAVLGKQLYRPFSFSASSTKVFQKLKSNPPLKRDARAHIDIIRQICETDNFVAVRGALKQMQSEGFRLNPAFTILIKTYGRSGLFEDAALVLHQMKSFNCHPDVGTYRCLVDVLMKGACHEKLVDIQHEMLRDEVVPDITTGKNLLTNLLVLGQVSEFHRFYQKLKDLGCHIPQEFVTQVLRENQIEVDPVVTQNLRQNLIEIDPVTYTIKFCSLVDEIVLDRMNFKALKALDSMLAQVHSLDSATVLVVIDGLCMLNKLGRSKVVLAELRKRGAVPEGLLYDVVVNCVEGRLGDVENVWTHIGGGGVDSGNFNYVRFIRYLCGKGEMQEAVKMFKMVIEAGYPLDQQSYIAFIGGLCKAGEGDFAKEVVPLMKREGYYPDMVTYIGLFQCFCNIGNMYEADIILRKMIGRNYEADICVYTSFISGLCRTGKLREAKKLFQKLIKKDAVVRVPFVKSSKRAIFQLNVSGAIPEFVAYATYMRSLCNVGKFKEAGVLLKEMLQKGFKPDFCVLNSFIEGFCKSGKIDEARKFYHHINERGLISCTESTVSLIHGLCEADRSDDAMHLFDELMKDGFVPTANTCNALLTCYWKAGKGNIAKKLFERMLNRSCGSPDISTYNIMLDGLCNHGYVVEACFLFQLMRNTRVLVNGVSYSTVFRGLCSIGDLKSAHKHLNEMIETGYVFTFNRWKSFSEAMHTDKPGCPIAQ